MLYIHNGFPTKARLAIFPLIFFTLGGRTLSRRKEENSENYYWDGKQNGRTIPSGTYWYVLEWTEPDTGVRMNYKGWVLLKNRN